MKIIDSRAIMRAVVRSPEEVGKVQSLNWKSVKLILFASKHFEFVIKKFHFCHVKEVF